MPAYLVEGAAEEAGGGGAWNMGVPVTGFLNTGDYRHGTESCAEHDFIGIRLYRKRHAMGMLLSSQLGQGQPEERPINGMIVR